MEQHDRQSIPYVSLGKKSSITGKRLVRSVDRLPGQLNIRTVI